MEQCKLLSMLPDLTAFRGLYEYEFACYFDPSVSIISEFVKCGA